MPAPKYNKFWKKRARHGKDKIFSTPGILWESACEYFLWCEKNPLMEEKVFHTDGNLTYAKLSKMRAMTEAGLCIFLGCSTDTFRNYGTKDEYKDYFGVIKKIKETIYAQKFEGASAGFLNANIIARDLGLTDKKEVKADIKVADERNQEIKKMVNDVIDDN